MPYLMLAPQEYAHTFTIATVGRFDTFRDFLTAYPKVKAYYGDELKCSYIPKAEVEDDEDWWDD